MRCKNCGLPIEIDGDGEYIHSNAPKYYGCALASGKEFSFTQAAVPDPLRESHAELLAALKALRARFDSDMIVENSPDDILFNRVYAAIANAEKVSQ